MTTKQDIMNLANELQSQFQRLQERVEFLALKENEARQGGDFAYMGWLATMEECRNEHTLLMGHAFMLERMINESKIKPPRPVLVLLARIHAPPGVRVY